MELIGFDPAEILINEREWTDSERRNIQVVVQSYPALINGDHKAIDELFQLHYKDHSRLVNPGTLAGLKNLLVQLRESSPQTTIRLDKVLADDDFVIIHSAGRFESEAEWDEIIEIYRLESGRIVEHWEVIDSPDSTKP
jgi:predicted SnoaL-like aldol condensation-catalyzing enzyme